MIRKMSSLLLMILMVQLVAAQSVVEYYQSASGTSGRQLKTALFEIIKNHKVRSYDDLWTDFRTTDRREDGKVWDMYSNTTSYTFGRPAQGGNYSKEGDAYNREHSFPKSWFNNEKPMYSDLFHLYPTDGYVNNRRSNYPFGETENPTWTSHNGWSKLGPSSISGYDGTVFEPNDEYKGDFARTYFYMATAYEDRIAKWKCSMLAGNSYPAYTEWAIQMLLRWAKEDPVSQKEINRNNAVYGIQNNRNPYIDYPGLEQMVWGNRTSEKFDPNDYNTDDGGDSDTKEVATPQFSVMGGLVKAGTEVIISCATVGATIYYRVNGGELKSHYASAVLTINEDVIVEAYAMLGDKMSNTIKVAYTVAVPSEENVKFVKIDHSSDLVVGARYLIVCEGSSRALSEAAGKSKDYRGFAEVTIADNEIYTAVSTSELPTALTLGGNSQGYSFYDAASKTYLALTSDKNKLHSVERANTQEALWTIEFTEGMATISNVKYKGRSIKYNSSAPRFSTYTSGQFSVSLFKETVPSAIEYPKMERGTVDVYTVEGRLLRDDVPVPVAVKGLPKGIYIVGGVKMIVK